MYKFEVGQAKLIAIQFFLWDRENHVGMKRGREGYFCTLHIYIYISTTLTYKFLYVNFS